MESILVIIILIFYFSTWWVKLGIIALSLAFLITLCYIIYGILKGIIMLISYIVNLIRTNKERK